MTPDLAPSSTLRRAARKELERLERARQRIRERQEKLEAELEKLKAQLAELSEREGLLNAVGGEIEEADAAETSGRGRPREVLKGAAIRERAARRFYATHGAGKPMPYRHWLELLLREEVEIPGQDPAATFLTNLNRSPVVVRGAEPGTYAIDDEAPARLRAHLAEREAELRDVTQVIAREDSAGTDLREHRNQLVSDIRRLERLIAEAERVLVPAPDESDLRAAA